MARHEDKMSPVPIPSRLRFFTPSRNSFDDTGSGSDISSYFLLIAAPSEPIVVVDLARQSCGRGLRASSHLGMTDHGPFVSDPWNGIPEPRMHIMRYPRAYSSEA